MSTSTITRSVAVLDAPSRARSPGAITRRPQARYGLDLSGTTLYVDTAVLPLAHVVRYDAAGVDEKDLSTAFATIAIFSGIAAVYVFGVVEIGWRTRYALEGVLFGAIALCGVAELFSARRQALYTFEIETSDGATTTFVTADTGEAGRLKAALDATLGKPA